MSKHIITTIKDLETYATECYDLTTEEAREKARELASRGQDAGLSYGQDWSEWLENCDEPAKTTTFIYHEDGGHQETIEGVTTMAEALGKAEAMCKGGEWGDEGALVSVWVEEVDEDGEQIDREDIEVSIEPDHEEMIRRAGGDTDCEHEWSSEGEGGCTENPGVWSRGGTTLVFKSHCTKCGLKRTEVSYGSQRNPGQADEVTYSAK